MSFRVTNVTRGKLLADKAERAGSFYSRFKGLMGAKALPMGSGLHIEPCNSIHMFFMKFAIDAVFLDRQMKVVKILHAIVPWRVSGIYPSARSVLELPAGTANASDTHEGDVLSFEKV